MVLSSSKEISSTEKLLDLIRNDDQQGKLPDTPTTSQSRKTKKNNVPGLLTGKNVSVGVDIGRDELKLVKVGRLSGSQRELLDYKKVPIKAGMSSNSPAFAGFLRSELDLFCGSGKAVDLWGLIQSEKVDVQNIRIPKVGKKQLENAVSWTVKKNTPFSEEKTVLDFEIQGEVIESGVRKLSVLACIAPKREIEEMEDLFNEIGFPLTGITLIPFALQNLFRTDWISSVDQTVATLYIGNDSSRIDIFSDGNLTMSRVIKAGVESMADSLMEEYAASSSDMMTLDNAKRLIYTLGYDAQPVEESARFGLDKEKIFEMISPALKRLVGQVERTFEHYAVTLGSDRVSFIYVFCDMDICRPFIDYVGNELRIGSEVLDPLSPENPYSGNAASDASVSHRVSLVSTLGLALSDTAYTPNLIFPFSDKEKLKNIKTFNRVIISTFAVVMLLLFGIFFWLGGVVDKKEVKLAGLEQQMDKGIQAIETPARNLVTEITGNRLTLKKFKDRYFGLAIIGELSKLTPEKLSLLSVKAGEEMAVKKEGEKPAKGMIIQGIVEGAPGSFEPVLAKYVLALSKSPMFNKVSIDKSSVGPFHASEALHFTLFVDFAEELK